jgi:hypothetical protein
MRDLAPYIYPLIFVALVLINYLAQRVARWQKQTQKQQLPRDEVPKPKNDAGSPPRGEPNRRREQLQQAKRLARQREEPTPRVQRPAEQFTRVRPVSDEPLEVREARARARRPEAPTAPAISARRVTGVRALLAERRNLRQAIVIMTVLGPCRAQQPPDVG